MVTWGVGTGVAVGGNGVSPGFGVAVGGWVAVGVGTTVGVKVGVGGINCATKGMVLGSKGMPAQAPRANATISKTLTNKVLPIRLWFKPGKFIVSS